MYSDCIVYYTIRSENWTTNTEKQKHHCNDAEFTVNWGKVHNTTVT